jgi:hypothetical protein
MRISQLMLAAAAVALVLPVQPAKPAVGDPVESLYFFRARGTTAAAPGPE